MEKQHHIQGGLDDATDGPVDAHAGARRLSLRSHDVIFATTLTVVAIGLLVVTWMNGGARQGQQAGPTTAVTSK